MIMGLFVLPLVPVLLRNAEPLTAVPGEQLGAPASPGWPKLTPARRCQPLSSRHFHIKQFSTKTSTTLNSASDRYLI